VIIEFKTGGPTRPLAEPGSGEGEFEGFEEFDQKEKDPSKYWYTTERLAVIEKVHDYLDSLPETGKVLSLATLYKTAVDLNGGKAFDNFALALLYTAISEKFRSILVTPYASVERDEARISTRVKDSMRSLRRAELIARVRKGLVEQVGLREDQFRVSGLMLLYNNMLQSLYTSQIKTIGSSSVALLAMFLLLFRSWKLAVIAFFPQFIASLSVLGIMGLGGIPLDVMTITIVSIAVGIGVEDAIHYVYRFQTEITKDRDYVQTMYRCHATIGNAMYYTSLAVTAGFSILAFSNFVPTILFGLLTGVAMVTACVSSQTLLPALILLAKPFGPDEGKGSGLNT
jgi:predicted RND superfamily exporter protein